MRSLSVQSTLVLASLSAIGFAHILFEPVPLRLHTGQSQELQWTVDRDYDLELLLVQRFDEGGQSGWKPVRTVFETRAVAAGSGSYDWTVPRVEAYDVSYSLWLSGSESQSDGYANLTNRFHIENGRECDFRPISAGQMAGVFLGFSACLLVFAGATAVLSRLRRQGGRMGCNDIEDALYSCSPVMDEKARLPLMLVQGSNKPVE